MPTTSDYLEQLEQDREDLVDNLETKGISGLTGDETFTELVPEVLNIPSGGGLDWSAIGYSEEPQIIEDDYNYSKNIYDNWDATQTDLTSKFANDKDLVYMPLIDISNATITQSMFSNCSNLKAVPLLDFSNVTGATYMFQNCSNLKAVPLLDFSNVTSLRSMFNGCSNLESVPVFDTSSVSGNSSFQSVFQSCFELTDQSLDNILQMCINATSYTASNYKTLSRLGITSTDIYSVSRIQALPHYQDFIDAGWTIGYS